MISGFIDSHQTLWLWTNGGYVQMSGAPVLAYVEVARMFAMNRGDRLAYYGDINRYAKQFRNGIEELKRITDFFDEAGVHLSCSGMTALRYAARLLGFMPDEMECSKPRVGRCQCGGNECHCVPKHTSQYGSSCVRCGSSMHRVVSVPRDPITEAWAEYFASMVNQ